MTHEIILAGFGGQGILSSGKMLAQAGMAEGKNVSWLPSYGPEMRGGTANCCVVISDEPVGSPILNSADVVMAMNRPSMEKFESYLVPGGVLIYDNSIITVKPQRADIKAFGIPATQMASDMGNQTFAGIILLGKIIAESKAITEQGFETALNMVLKEKYKKLIPEEMKALRAGMEY